VAFDVCNLNSIIIVWIWSTFDRFTIYKDTKSLNNHIHNHILFRTLPTVLKLPNCSTVQQYININIIISRIPLFRNCDPRPEYKRRNWYHHDPTRTRHVRHWDIYPRRLSYHCLAGNLVVSYSSGLGNLRPGYSMKITFYTRLRE
jgi:hypothetical protein